MTVAPQLRAEGFRQGREEGIEETLEKIAMKLLRARKSMDQIAETTDFTGEEITALAKKHNISLPSI